ncbi:hypothetical protein U0035_01240 [Niabella yanshanensis]|uniref:DoxX family protein n=1 Tax=Niabella yanshanensis TaxID=577386 RepID=A0ABZ0W6A2_9BACT|nr:hypothetical protein [Niabella yanshanensis]WQD38767.1 hypothetical protein U0035_01240 [Niabella yanshanensis]
MKRLSKSAELLLGLVFLFGAFNGVMYILGLKAPFPVNRGSELALALANTKYIFLLQKTVEFISAILLLTGKMQFAALLALTPIVASIVLYHIFDEVNPAIVLILLPLFIMALSGHKRRLILLFKLS